VTSLKSKGDVDVAALRLADWQGALTQEKFSVRFSFSSPQIFRPEEER
jgi:hypothetical protein